MMWLSTRSAMRLRWLTRGVQTAGSTGQHNQNTRSVTTHLAAAAAGGASVLFGGMFPL